jgi:hypothetical protein
MRKLFLIATASILWQAANAQTITPTVLNSSGGTAPVGNKFYVDWSVGEMTLVNTMQNSGYSGLIIVTNGFIQPPLDDAAGDESYITSTKPVPNDNLRVYPNPATNYVMIEFPVQESGKIRLTLYNSLGEVVYDKQITTYGQGMKERISMAAFMQGTYMLRVVTAGAGATPKEAVYKIFKAN